MKKSILKEIAQAGWYMIVGAVFMLITTDIVKNMRATAILKASTQHMDELWEAAQERVKCEAAQTQMCVVCGGLELAADLERYAVNPRPCEPVIYAHDGCDLEPSGCIGGWKKKPEAPASITNVTAANLAFDGISFRVRNKENQ